MVMPTGKPTNETSLPYPTLSTSGWLLGMYEKVDRIFSHYFLSQYNQTVIHRGFVISCAKSVQMYGTRPLDLARKIEEDLTFLLEPYLDHVEVIVTYDDPDDGKVNYEILVRIVHQGQRWENFKGIEVQDMKFREIVNINNAGGVSLV